MTVRSGVASDGGFFEAMLFEASFWDPGATRPALLAMREQKAFAQLLEGWERPGDRAVVAEERETRLGAAWLRLWTPHLHSDGLVDERTPELGIAAAPTHRGKGIGRALLRSLVASAGANGFRALSLSVGPANHARQLYESEGFRKVRESGTSWTLVLDLDRAPS